MLERRKETRRGSRQDFREFMIFIEKLKFLTLLAQRHHVGQPLRGWRQPEQRFLSSLGETRLRDLPTSSQVHTTKRVIAMIGGDQREVSNFWRIQIKFAVRQEAAQEGLHGISYLLPVRSRR